MSQALKPQGVASKPKVVLSVHFKFELSSPIT